MKTVCPVKFDEDNPATVPLSCCQTQIAVLTIETLNGGWRRCGTDGHFSSSYVTITTGFQCELSFISLFNLLKLLLCLSIA